MCIMHGMLKSFFLTHYPYIQVVTKDVIYPAYFTELYYKCSTRVKDKHYVLSWKSFSVPSVARCYAY